MFGVYTEQQLVINTITNSSDGAMSVRLRLKRAASGREVARCRAIYAEHPTKDNRDALTEARHWARLANARVAVPVKVRT